MPKKSKQLSIQLRSRYRTLESTQKGIEDLTRRRLVTQRAAQLMYESLFLSAHVAIEGFIEQLFLGHLIDKASAKCLVSDVYNIKPRVLIRSAQIAREMVTGAGKRYIDWIPYDKTIEIAKIYFRNGMPFDELTVIEKKHLEKCHIIRNAIAHKSRHSLKLFERKVLGDNRYPPRERTPSGYLSAIIRVTPTQTRFSVYLAQLAQIAHKLAA